MTRLHLFRALNPTDKYPFSPIDLSFNGVRYDLILPPRIGITLTRLLSSDGPFRRLDNFCLPDGLDAIRSNPLSFELEQGIPAYAEYQSHVEMPEQGVPVGYIVQHAAANPVAAKQILLSIIGENSFTLDVIDWLLEHAPFIEYSGGFEVAHVCCFTNETERESALDTAAGLLDDAEPDLYQPHVTRLHIYQSTQEEENHA